MQPFDSIARIARTQVSGLLPEGVAILNYLPQRFDYLDRDGWSQQIAAGRILLNGRVVDDDRKIFNGDIIEFVTRQLEEPEVNWNIEILADTSRYIIVNKPAPLPCHPAGAYFNHTLWAWCRQVMKIEPHFCGRLDRETSGILIIGKDQNFASQIAKSAGIKEYIALVHGNFPESMDAAGFLSPDAQSVIRKKRRFSFNIPSDKYESCHTEFQLLAHDNGISLIKARLHTGRTHQIRATLSSLGFPLVGDKMYGLNEQYFLKFANNTLTAEDWKQLRLPHQALHCQHICIPTMNIDISTDIPQDFQTIMNLAAH